MKLPRGIGESSCFHASFEVKGLSSRLSFLEPFGWSISWKIHLQMEDLGVPPWIGNLYLAWYMRHSGARTPHLGILFSAFLPSFIPSFASSFPLFLLQPFLTSFIPFWEYLCGILTICFDPNLCLNPMPYSISCLLVA